MQNSAQTNDTSNDEIKVLEEKIHSATLPSDLRQKAVSMISRASLGFKYGGYFTGFDQVANYIDWIVSLPWDKRSQDNLDLIHAKEILEHNHYGLADIKDRILEYLSVMKL